MRIALCLALLLAACQDSQPKLKTRQEACAKNRDCLYGLDCVDAATAPSVAAAGDPRAQAVPVPTA